MAAVAVAGIAQLVRLAANGLPADRQVTGLIAITRQLNPGTSFGVLPADGLWLIVALVALALSPALVRSRRLGAVHPVMVGAALGGVASNALERVLFGGVTDYFVAGPLIINIADAGIAVGAAGIAWGMLRPSRFVERPGHRATAANPG